MELFTHILPQNMVKGDIIRLNTSREGHWNTEMPGKRPESAPTNFGEALNLALGKVNDQLVYADDLAQKMVADPSSVQVHNMLIAQEKARMSLTFTKNVVDLAVKTYRELSNLR